MKIGYNHNVCLNAINLKHFKLVRNKLYKKEKTVMI